MSVFWCPRSPAKIRQAETRKQKHDRRDARLLLTLLAENRFAAAIDGTQLWSQAWPLLVEPGGPARTAGIASDSSCQ
jgi:hypothetical protein